MVTKNPQLSKITVVIPVYNSMHSLKECMLSLKNQTDNNFEVIIVDDRSVDNSLQICKDFGFKIISLNINKGQAVARNIGVKEGAGEIIAFLDSDAIAPSDWLKRYRYLLTVYKDADMICSGYSGNITNTAAADFAFQESVYRRLNIPLHISSSTSSNCVIYKKVFEEVGGYPEYYVKAKMNTVNQKAVATNEDAELGFLLSQKEKKIIWSHDNSVKHYFRDSWKGYLKQQIGFSRYAVLSIFKFPRMLYNKDIYSEEKILPQLLIIILILSPIPGLFLGYTNLFTTLFIEIFGLSLFYFFHRRFILYLKYNMKNYSACWIFFWLFVSRLCWLYGVILGLKDGCYMFLNDCWLKYVKLKKLEISKKNNRRYQGL